MFAAGGLAAAALLLKPEFGLAAYATLGLLTIVRGIGKSVDFVRRDVGALLPGVAVCAVVIVWMVSLEGVVFITQENIASWPTSYFMKHFGRFWLEFNGLALSTPAILGAARRTIFPASVWLQLYLWKRGNVGPWRAGLILTPAVLVFCVWILGLGPVDLARSIVFPSDMVLYVGVAALFAWWNFWRQPAEDRDPAIPLLLSFSALLAFRILTKMEAWGYSIYYNGPVILGYLFLVRAVLRRFARSPHAAFERDLFVCLTPVVCIAVLIGHFTVVRGLVPLTTRRGTVRVPKDMADNYSAAISFMRDKAAAGEYVLSVPEDTSLYFLSETYCPTRVYLFVPGVVAPGKMTTEMFQELERKRVRYLLWSNRTFPEYGVPIFGTDFDQEIGDYFRSRYRLVGPLTARGDWRADVWERRPEAAFE
jgi:hypothetical protein